MGYELYPSPQSVVVGFIELTRYLMSRLRLEARRMQQEAPVRLDA